MLEIIEPKTDIELERTRQRWLEAGRRILYVDYRAETFSSVLWEERLAMVGIPVEYELELTLPRLPPFRVCLIDAIGKYANDEVASGLEVDEEICVAELPSGWKLSELRRYYPEPLPPTYAGLDFQRLNWYLGIYGFETSATVWVHPDKNRCLSETEWKAIIRNNGREGFNSWVNSLARIPAASDALETAFDMRAHCPQECANYINRRASIIFNFDENGRQRFAWEAIAAHYRLQAPAILQEVPSDDNV